MNDIVTNKKLANAISTENYRGFFSVALAATPHPFSAYLLNNFRKTGGNLIFENCDETSLMSYNRKNKDLHINVPYMLDAINNKDEALILRSFIHETYHHYTYQTLEHLHPELRNYLYAYNEKSVQKINQCLEISALYNDIITSYEQGNFYWKSFKTNYPKLARRTENFLKSRNIKSGKSIPNQLLPVIGNYAVLGFCLFVEDSITRYPHCDNYKGELLMSMYVSPQIGCGKNTITCTEFLNKINIHPNFSEHQLESLALFSKMTNFPRDISFSENKDKPSLLITLGQSIKDIAKLQRN